MKVVFFFCLLTQLVLGSATPAPVPLDFARTVKEVTAATKDLYDSKGAAKDVFRSVLYGWYMGLARDRGADFMKSGFDSSWTPGPKCDLSLFRGYTKAMFEQFVTFVRKVTSASGIATLTAATEHYSASVATWGSNVLTFVENPDCKVEFLRGPVYIGQLLIPYGASYWTTPKFREVLTGKNIRTFEKFLVEANKRKMQPRDSKRIGPLQPNPNDAALDYVRDFSKAAGFLTQYLFQPVIIDANTKVEGSAISEAMKKTLPMLFKYFRCPAKDLFTVYEEASIASRTYLNNPGLTDWRTRSFSDIYMGNVRSILEKQTPTSFSTRMFTDDKTVKKIGDIKQGLPPADDSFLAVGGGFDDEAFLGVEGRANAAAPAPEFNWFTDDTRGQYQDCVLAKPSSQGFCAACWSFAATTMLDYRLCGLLKRNNLQPLANPVVINGRAYRPGQTKLSNQICLSCTRSGDCVSGGAPSDCLGWVKNNGLVSHACQPYKSWELFKTAGDTSVANGGKLQCPAVGTCAAGGVNNMRGNVVTALQTGYVTGLDNIRVALQSGPVTLIMATPATFIAWGGKADGKPDGIFSSEGAPRVEGAHSRHIVTVFGYGQEMVGGKTRKFFLCLNSWGSLYNPFFFRGMWFNMEENNKGPWFKLDAEDPALELDAYPAYWATPGLKVGRQVVPVNGKGKDGKPYWKGAVTNTGKMVPEGKINLGNKGSGSGGNIFNPINAPNSDGY